MAKRAASDSSFDEKKRAHKVSNDGSETATVVSEVKSEAQQLKPVSFATLLRYSTKLDVFLNVVGIIAAVGAGAAQPLMSLLFGNLTQDFVTYANVVAQSQAGNSTATALIPEAARHFKSTAAKDAGYLSLIGVGMFICCWVYMQTWVYTGEVNAKRIREKYLQATLRQDIAYFDNVGAGEVATRIQTDTHLIQQGISEKVAVLFTYIGAFVTGYIIAYVRNWRLALALSGLLPTLGITGTLMALFVTKYQQRAGDHVANSGGLAEEVVSTIRTAQAFGTQKALSDIYQGYIENILRLNINEAMVNAISFAICFFAIYASYALAFNYGTTLLNQNRADAGDIIGVFFAILIGSISLALMAPEAQAVTMAQAAGAKLFETIDRVPDIDSANPGGLRPASVTGQITLENVKFYYPTRPSVEILKGLSISFEAGKTAALVGASGSGKSTIVSLVERFYDPVEGSVKLDGQDIKDLNLKWLRSQMGLVLQEPTLFATTIEENIAYGLINTPWENVDAEKKFALVKEACVKANADGFISKLPNGYATMVGERGFLLSGGQKQRIAIARAIVSDPKILLLDEATSALDTQSEGIVQDALDKAAKGRTTITIAHRLSTVKDADAIYVMGDGVVLESGTHTELLAKGGAYYHLVQAQKLKDGQALDSTESDSEDEINAEHPEKLHRHGTSHSILSDSEAKGAVVRQQEQGEFSFFYLFKRMGRIGRDLWGHYSLGTIGAAVNGAAYPLFGLVFARGIEGLSKATSKERRDAGDRTALLLFIVALVSAIATGAQNYYFSSGAFALAARLRSLAFKALLRQDVEYFDRDENTSGALTSRLSDHPQRVNGLAGLTLGAIVQAISTVILGSVLGIVFIWKLGLVAVACIPFIISTGYFRLRVVVMKDRQNKQAHDESAHLACEAAGSIRTVASLTREDDCLRQYSEALEVPLRKSNQSSIWSNALYAFSQSTVFWVIALVFWYGSILIVNGEATTFEFFVALMSTTFGAMQAGNMFQFVPDMSSALGSGTELIRLFDAVPDIDAYSPAGKTPDAEKTRGHLRLENIHFRYPTRPSARILRGLSLDIKPGTYIALVGASGSGKSTVIQLLERFYDATSGEIYLDGERITDLNVQEYRKQIALVSQEPSLYSGTIRFNILLGAIKPENEVTDEEIVEACRNANILEFIQSLPDGFDTQVGGKGSQLSGGQKQRIAIARALLRNPKVLLLDEATSALDSDSEKVVQAALDQAAKGRTTIAIAHRLSTIQNADVIYFVKEGRISEAGTHDQLLAKRGDYYEYVQLQALSRN